MTTRPCPHCGRYPQPRLTVDVIIAYAGGIVLVERRNPPFGWAMPGGFVDEGESCEAAARREAREETGLALERLRQFHTYSDPGRDPRHHSVSVVFTAQGHGELAAGDDARRVAVYGPAALPDLVFDHGAIISDYFRLQQNSL